MDRNTFLRPLALILLVALRKESVDRNTNFFSASLFDLPSLSARRAWIEITLPGIAGYLLWSLSARRAWIEMLAPRLADMSAAVALRKESVDRNAMSRLIRLLLVVALRKESVDRNSCWLLA